MSFTAWSGAFWMGALGTTLGYGWWLKLLQEEKVGTLSVSIFLQPVAGSIAGILFLGENLDFLQWLGAALILTGVVASTRLDANIRQ
jgi:drug/metabolite transporter (DMT)-like permease